MSLKDRLGSQNKTIVNIEKKSQELKYYPTSEISQAVDSLGEIDTLFADDEINTISVMGAKNVFIERKGKRSKISLTYRDNVRLENIIRKNAKFHGVKFDETHPYIEFSHKTGINVFAALPPLSNVATMIIKCYKDKFASIKNLLEIQAMSKEMALLIEALATLKLNIIIAGSKNTLKTTLLNTIAKKIPQNNNGVIFDYSNELKIENSNITTFNFKNYENKDLIESIISSNPDKIFINDCKDLSYFSKFIENGYKGICATYYAQSPYDILQEVYLNKADIVIFVERKGARRFISSISLVNGSELEDIFRINENLEHNSTGIVPDFYDNIEESGVSISSAIFEEGYKHTYQKTIQNDVLSNTLKKNINPDILKKFKKDLEIKNDNAQKEEKAIQEQENTVEQSENE